MSTVTFSHALHDWFDLRWFIAIFVFAIPVTGLLWIVWAVARLTGVSLSGYRFASIGFALPVLYVVAFVGVPKWMAGRQLHRVTEQMQGVTLQTFEDEELMGVTGPIGVRVRFRVSYPRGLALDADQVPAMFLYPSSRVGPSFVLVRRVMKPRVSGVFPPGTFEISEEFLPDFMPRFLVVSQHETSASDHCFRWYNLSREQILSERAEPVVAWVYLAFVAGDPVKHRTAHAYLPADFYASAVRAGAVECGVSKAEFQSGFVQHLCQSPIVNDQNRFSCTIRGSELLHSAMARGRH
jgi:hypothetical protein